MKTVSCPEKIQQLCASAPGPIVLVPTMGALHAGHLSLLQQARQKAGPHGTVVATIFVNPTQFGPSEDLSRYPRPFEADQQLCEDHGADLLFAPEVSAIYHPDSSTWVDEQSVSLRLCGASRPGHFRGVCTIVLKLFLLTRPTLAIFGQKDFQQCAVIARMVRDLHVPVQLFFAPTIRELDGLALSSRNIYLSPEERAQAVVLSQALQKARAAFENGITCADSLQAILHQHIHSAPLARIDYAELVHADTLQPVTEATHDTVATLAVFFGKTRLIDNLRFSQSSARTPSI